MDKDFERMGIYDLRNYARLVGVKAPTTLKRDELIEKINQIIEGGAPKAEITKKGRPPRHKQTDEYMLDIILPNNMFDQTNAKYKPIQSQNIFPSYQNILSESSTASVDNLPFEGYFDDYSKDYGIAYLKGYLSDYYKENVIVLQNLIKENKLKRGDYIKGVAKFIQSKNLLLATQIDVINQNDAHENFERTDFESIRPLFPTQKIDTNGIVDGGFGAITKGARVTCSFSDQATKFNAVKNMLAVFSKNNINSVLISIGDRPEEIGELMRMYENVNFVEYLPSQMRENFFSRVDMVVTNACNRVECGENVAIVFYSTKNFMNAYKQQQILSTACNDLQANILAENKFFDIYNLSKYSENGSLTIVSIDSTEYISMQANCKIDL